MDQPARIEHWICRRHAPRFRIGMPARLITLERHLSVMIDELSEGGARVTMPVPHAFTVCVLRWIDYHAFAEVRWIDERAVGLQFAKPVPGEWILGTLAQAPGRAPHLGGVQRQSSPGSAITS